MGLLKGSKKCVCISIDVFSWISSLVITIAKNTPMVAVRRQTHCHMNRKIIISLVKIVELINVIKHFFKTKPFNHIPVLLEPFAGIGNIPFLNFSPASARKFDDIFLGHFKK